MKPSTDTNMTSDQWSYLHKNIIFLVIILILRHVLFILIQKYLSPVINSLLCCMNRYSGGVNLKSCSCKILQPYVAAMVQMCSDAVFFSTGALLMKTVIKNNR